MVLKRLSEAIADNDNILALIRGSAVNHNGMSNSLSAPNGLAQQAVIRQALKNAGVEPAEVSYIDAHAVGTGIGDAIEFKALQTVYGANRPPDLPCGVGSVKTNIGHLEAAAGISALIKVILSLQHEAIPPHLHLQQLNPYISLKDTFYIPTQLQSWQRDNNRLAGVSAFGFGGTNAHVIEAEAPRCKRESVVKSIPSHLVTFSASNELALQQLAQKYSDFLAAQPQLDLKDLAFTANTGRNHFQHRLCLITESISQLQQQLTTFSDRHSTENLLIGKVVGRKRPKTAWFFPGNSSNFEVTAALIQTQPAFRRAIERCEQILHHYLDRPLFSDSSGKLQVSPVEKIKRDRCTFFTVEYALAQLWLAWGIKPKVLMGQGIGELVAATVSGIIELEDALNLVAIRPLQTDEAASNSLLRAINRVRPQIPLLSSRRDSAGQKIVTPEYWYDYWQQTEIDSTLDSRAEPNGSKRRWTRLGCDSSLHGGNPRTDKPHKGDSVRRMYDNALSRNPLAALSDYPLVLTMGTRTTAPANETQYLFSYGTDFKTSWQEMMQSLGTLYVGGIEINWSNFADRDCRPIPLPTYSFQRQRYWFAPAPETTVEPMPQTL
ncbi:MAG: ketoacyl-synthetase C-terminal extension domain-containing protein [Pleurocapsa sp.]